MARPKTYNREEALQDACDAFWKFGYRGLSVRALENETELNQFAIQKDFGGKQSIYLEALQLYVDETERSILAPMREGGIDGIEHFFRSLSDASAYASSQWGCMVVNAGVENAVLENGELAQIANEYWDSLSSSFHSALRRSDRDGELRKGLDLDDSTNALVVAAVGIHTANRIENSLSAGAPLARLILHTIHSWKKE